MTWNYRLVRYRDNKGFGLHEVYYDEAGRADGMTVEPISFTSDIEAGPEEVRQMLATACADAITRPILDEAEQWPAEPASQIPDPGA